MDNNELAPLRRFNSDSIYVNFYPHVYPSSTPNMTEAQKLSELKESSTQPKEVKLKAFLGMGSKFLGFLKQIWQTDDKKVRNSLKRRNLGAGSISATFHTRDKETPLSAKIKHYNGLIALDFDDVQDVEAGKKRISELPYVYYVGLSSSKRGFFAIIPLDNDDYTRPYCYFSALEAEMAKLGFKIDKACSDVTRLRFVSFDLNPYFNEDCELYSLPEDFDVEAARMEHEGRLEEQENPRLARVRAYAAEWEKKKVALDDYDDWRTMAMALSNLGEAGWDILDRVSQFSKNYDAADNRKKYEEFLKSTRSISIGSFFFKCQEYGVIPPSVPHYEMIPFPVDVFPETVRRIIQETHKCLNFSVDHIASSLLFTASVAVGNSVIVEIKNEWVDKAILYIRIPQTFPRGGPRALKLRTTVDFRKREVLGALTGRVPGGP